MFKKPEQIKPLPSGMTDAFSKTLARQGFVASVQQPAPKASIISESVMSEIDYDLRSMSDKDFKAEYKMTKAEMRIKLKKNESVTEAVKELCSCDDSDYTSKGMCKECGKPREIEESYMSGGSKFKKEQAGMKKCPPMSHVKEMCERGMTVTEICEMHPDCDQKELKQMVSDCKEKMNEALDPVNPKTAHRPFSDRKDKDIDNNGKVDDSDEYLHKRRKAIAKSLAIQEDAHLEEGFEDMLKAQKERNKPQPNGGAGKKQGTAYGGSKQKDAKEVPMKKEEIGEAGPGLWANIHAKRERIKNGSNERMRKVGEKGAPDSGTIDSLSKREEVVAKAGNMKKIQIKSRFNGSVLYSHTSMNNTVALTVLAAIADTVALASADLRGADLRGIDLRLGEFRGADLRNADLRNADLRGTDLRNADLLGANILGAKIANKKSASELTHMKEELHGDQHKLDKNKNGKLDAHDFKLIRKEKKESFRPMNEPNSKLSIQARQLAAMSPAERAKKATADAKAEKDYNKQRAKNVFGDSPAAGLSIRKKSAELAEASNYKLYHSTFSSAVQEAIAVAKKQGYEVDEEDWQSKVATGPKKPSKDKTNSYTIDLTKGGSPTKKKLQIQVYNMGEKYELNTYVQ